MNTPIRASAAAALCAGLLWVGGTSAMALDGGLEIDHDRLSFTNLSPGSSQSGFVAMTNTSTQALFISAITMRTQTVDDVSLTYTACAQPWVDGDCGSESLTVADYDLMSLPTSVKTLDYVIESGHTTYFKLDAHMDDASTSGNTSKATQLTFKWTALTDPPPGAHTVAMPSTLTLEGLRAPATETPQARIPELVEAVLARTGVSGGFVLAGGAAALLIGGGLVLRARARSSSGSLMEDAR